MATTREQAELEFKKYFTNRSFTEQDYLNAQKYGLSIFKQSAQKITGGIRGTLPPEPKAPLPPSIMPEGKALPQAPQSPLSNFSFAVSQMRNLVNARMRPSIEGELGGFRGAGLAMNDPLNIRRALEMGTISRREVEQPVFERMFDVIQEQEENKKQLWSAFGSIIQKDPSILAGLSSDDFTGLQRGFVSTELMQKIGELALITKKEKPEKSIIEKMVLEYPDAGITLQDTLEQAQEKLAKSRIYQKKTRLTGVAKAGGYPKGFWSAAKTATSSLRSGEKWGTVWDRMKMQFPTVRNEDLDTALGIEWRKEGAFEEYKKKQYKETQPRQFELQADIWKELAENPDLDNEAKKQWIMSQGFDPEDFGIY